MVSITADVEFHIRSNYPWPRLPSSVKSSLGNAPGLYDKVVVEYSIKNQLRWRGNIVRSVRKDERKYYESLLQYSREHLMLYPYHLQDMLVEGLRVTPFAYYSGIMADIMLGEKSYDSLPNFTAADCLRLMGIGRNQYIDLMNQYRAKKYFRRRGIKDLLPSRPAEVTRVEPWWELHVGYVTEDDIRLCSDEEHKGVDMVIDRGTLQAGLLKRAVVFKLYNRGLLYFDIPISEGDIIVVPPLQGFVMNRVQGDYFETLLYKIFVSIDEHTSIGELASVLQIDLGLVKNAVSVFIRLGFAYKKSQEGESPRYHGSWTELVTCATPDVLPLVVADTPTVADSNLLESPSPEGSLERVAVPHNSSSAGFQKRIGFLFDSTLTAFLMMGNLSQGLKSHAVTMFEVGKLTDEVLDSFFTELDKVTEQAEGEARRYYEHAITLRNTLKFLRHNPSLVGGVAGGCGLSVDLLRCESMASLDGATLSRVLQKNYSVLVSMAPLSQEVRSVSSCSPPHLGPPVAEMNSVWFKLWLYHSLHAGPPSLLLAKGARLRTLPAFLKGFTRVLVTTWGHDPTSVVVSNLLLTVNDALTHSAVLVQAHGWREDGEEEWIAFPFDQTDQSASSLLGHPRLRRLQEKVDLTHTCGYITLLKSGAPPSHHHQPPHPHPSQQTASRHKQEAEISEFLEDLRELGIGEGETAHTSRETGTTAATSPQINAPSSSVAPGDGMTTEEREMDAQWVPLELCFGVPLFSEAANLAVCKKVEEFGLFGAASLAQQTQANRVLALDVLTFINKHQDVPYFSEGADNSHFSDSNSQLPPVAMPTRSLLFLNGTLSTFHPR